MKIEQLKQLGHELIEEHMLLVPHHKTKSKRVQTYEELERCMNGKTPHFGNMKTKAEVMNAIGTLKKMIARKKFNQVK